MRGRNELVLVLDIVFQQLSDDEKSKIFGASGNLKAKRVRVILT